jgi:uncharacterized protein YceH (UPF0502 family)
VQTVVDALSRRHMLLERSGFGSRVPKYQQLFCNTEYGSLKFTPQELAIVCELLLRGPQTPGELRSRASRMAAFGDVSEVEAVLERLRMREDGPFVLCLPREAGRRESRYAHRFGDTPADAAAGRDMTAAPLVTSAAATAASAPEGLEERLRALEARVSALEAALNQRR